MHMSSPSGDRFALLLNLGEVTMQSAIDAIGTRERLEAGSRLRLRARLGTMTAAVGVAAGVGVFLGSGVVSLNSAADQFPWWNDSIFTWTLSIVGLVAGTVALASASGLLMVVFISLGARIADPTGERFERFWGVARRERLFASDELRRRIAAENEITILEVKRNMLEEWPKDRPKAS
jgi:hypothetical protein